MAGTFFLSPAEEVSPAVGRPSPQPGPSALRPAPPYTAAHRVRVHLLAVEQVATTAPARACKDAARPGRPPPTPPAALQAGRRPAPVEVPAPLLAVLGPLRERHSRRLPWPASSVRTDQRYKMMYLQFCHQSLILYRFIVLTPFRAILVVLSLSCQLIMNLLT